MPTKNTRGYKVVLVFGDGIMYTYIYIVDIGVVLVAVLIELKFTTQSIG